jgi:hypothetical protein
MNNIGISLGYNCHSASWGVTNALRKTKKEGYQTCPFDAMLSNYPGIIKCIEDNFEFFCNPNYLQIVKVGNEYQLTNTYYNFFFNHESPGHGDLYIKQSWPEGKNHFINNNYQHFINRYLGRIQNFKDYLNDKNNFITFILHRYKSNDENVNELHEVIKRKYPQIKYKIIFIELVDTLDFYIGVHTQMGFTKDDNEIKRIE